MRQLRFIVSAIAIFASIVGCNSRTPNKAEKALVGQWFCKGDDYNFFMILNPDGSHVQSVEGRPVPKPNGDTWRVEGDKLVIALKQSNGRITEVRGNYVLTGNRLEWTREDLNIRTIYEKVK
ncbi:MAG: hypothetical protein ACM359_13525 [Bacillota bacterium]